MADESDDWFAANAPQQANEQPDWFAQNAPKPVATEERSIPSKIGHAVVDTLKSFVPQSVGEAALAPVTMLPGVGKTGRLLSNIAFGKPIAEGLDPLAGIPVVQRIPQIIEAEKTPAGSQERFTTAAGTLLDLGMIAGLKSAPEIAAKPKPLAEVAGIERPSPTTPVTPETPIAATEPVAAEPIATPYQTPQFNVPHPEAGQVVQVKPTETGTGVEPPPLNKDNLYYEQNALGRAHRLAQGFTWDGEKWVHPDYPNATPFSSDVPEPKAADVKRELSKIKGESVEPVIPTEAGQPHEVGDTVKFTEPSVAYRNGEPITVQNNKAGRITLIRPDGKIEIKGQDGGYRILTSREFQNVSKQPQPVQEAVKPQLPLVEPEPVVQTEAMGRGGAEPTVPKGMTRVYRGGVKGAEGDWFSTERDTAEFHQDNAGFDGPARLSYVDVPTEDLAKYQDAAYEHPDVISGKTIAENNDLVLPKELSGSAATLHEIPKHEPITEEPPSVPAAESVATAPLSTKEAGVSGIEEPVAQTPAAGTGGAIQERLQQPAIRLPNGQVFTGENHGVAMDAVPLGTVKPGEHVELGFSTDQRPFVESEEAFKIAKTYAPNVLPRADVGLDTIGAREAGAIPPVSEAPVSTTVKTSTEEIPTAATLPKEAGEIPPTEPPIVTPETPAVAPQKPSKIGQSIEAKAVEAKLTKGFAETAGYDPVTITGQSQMATDLVRDNLPLSRAMVRGEAPLQEGLRPVSLITAMEEHLVRNPDARTAYELANSPLTSSTSVAAQDLRLMGERVPDSITAKFAEIKRARTEGLKLRGETSEKVAADIGKEIVKQSSKRPTWEAFIESIIC